MVSVMFGTALYYFYISSEKNGFVSDVDEIRPHLYGFPEVDISKTRIKAVYAVPKNKTDFVYADWKSVLEEALGKSKKFHGIQFRGKSALNYDVYPDPVFLLNEAPFYDSNETNFGNPRALINIGEEIEKRIFQEDGDLYSGEFSEFKTGEYSVLTILYEGVGAAGGIIQESEFETPEEIAASIGLDMRHIFVVDIKSVDGFSLLSRSFLTEQETKFYGESLFYHEFAHVLGFPDQYDRYDIMGAGRLKPIEQAYLDRHLLQGVGVIMQ